jgi:hypothetical protein
MGVRWPQAGCGHEELIQKLTVLSVYIWACPICLTGQTYSDQRWKTESGLDVDPATLSTNGMLWMNKEIVQSPFFQVAGLCVLL